MKAVRKFVLELLLGIILSPLIILAGACLVILLPVDYIKYKNSLYYKNEKEKYSPYEASGLNFKVYNEIAQNNLPIRYIKNPLDTSIQSGWFVFNRTLIIINCFTFEYDYEKKKWFCGQTEDEGKEIITLDEYIEIELQEFNENVDELLCDEAIVLISQDDVYDLEMAAKEKRFMLYKGDRAGALKVICEEKCM